MGSRKERREWVNQWLERVFDASQGDEGDIPDLIHEFRTRSANQAFEFIDENEGSELVWFQKWSEAQEELVDMRRALTEAVKALSRRNP